MGAKSIKILLSGGSLSGSLIADLSNTDVLLLSSPRSYYNLLSNETESNHAGIYLLISNASVYIGQSLDLLGRIKEHDRNQPWWTKLVLLTSKNNSLNKAGLDYLENKLIKLATETNNLEILNKQIGNTPKVNRFELPELEGFLNDSMILLDLIGIDIFKSNNITINETPKETNTTNQPINETNPSTNSDMKLSSKSDVFDFLIRNNFYVFDTNYTTYASKQEIKKVYWANPNVESLKNKWVLVLNDLQKRTIRILEVPSLTFSIEGNNKLIVRSDRTYQIDLNLHHETFVDSRSKINFAGFVVKTLNY